MTASFIRPPRLSAGCTLGVVAPSSPIRGDRLDRGLEALRAMGFRVVVADHVHDRWGYLAGLDECRAADLSQFFARSDIDGIVCARGGYGAARMLEHVDWDSVRARPKVFIGFSDITTLHVAMERRAGLITFHGPMVTTLADPCSEACLQTLFRAVTGPEPMGEVNDPDRPTQTLVGGCARGRLAGGCLTLLCSAVGTADPPDFADRIVVLEDTDEPLYRVDRFLTQLRGSGLLQRAAGFVVGTSSHWDRYPEANHGFTLRDIWEQLLAPLGKPTVLGFPIGHVESPLTLPLGCMAELDADHGTLVITEPAVA